MDSHIYYLNNNEFLKENAGYARVLNSGYINTNIFINESTNYFKKLNKYKNKKNKLFRYKYNKKQQ